MGMCLVAKSDGSSLSYNYTGWKVINQLAVYDLPGTNDGELIEAEECRQIADAIEADADRYNVDFGGKDSDYGEAPAKEHAAWWRNSNGVEVW